MKHNVVLPFLLGLVFGITAMLISTRNQGDTFRNKIELGNADAASEKDEPEEIPVLVVAVETIPAYQIISEEMVTVRMMRISDVPPGALRKFEDLRGGAMTYKDQEGNLRSYKNHLGDMVLKSKAYQGDVITQSKLKWDSGFSEYTDIPEGFRVMTVSLEDSPVDIDSLRPYHLVDIFATYELQDAREDEKPQPILERIRIFEVVKPTTEYERKHVSLLLDPHQAGILIKAELKGPIIVALHEERQASDR